MLHSTHISNLAKNDDYVMIIIMWEYSTITIALYLHHFLQFFYRAHNFGFENRPQGPIQSHTHTRGLSN